MNNLQTGVHVIERSQLSRLESRGFEVPEPWLGVLDMGRTIEGFLPPPPDKTPLGVVGLETLLDAASDEATAVVQALRRSLQEGKHYFHYKQIPLVFLVNGQLVDELDEAGLVLTQGTRRWSLVPLLGRGLRAMQGEAGWWWGPQLG